MMKLINGRSSADDDGAENVDDVNTLVKHKLYLNASQFSYALLKQTKKIKYENNHMKFLFEIPIQTPSYTKHFKAYETPTCYLLSLY